MDFSFSACVVQYGDFISTVFVYANQTCDLVRMHLEQVLPTSL